MRYWLAAVMLCAATGGAAAQNFQTALTLSPQERRALEARLSTILDYARADEVTRFELPTGRSVTVLPYRTVRRQQNGRPCRGYRIDLEGSSSRMAVDGFRCKRRNGDAWVIVEPELVLAQEGSNERPQQTAAADTETRTTDEPLYADDLFASPGASEDAPPPLPRRAPERDAMAAAAPANGDGAGGDSGGARNGPFASRVAAVLGGDDTSRRDSAPPPREEDDTSVSSISQDPPAPSAERREPARSREAEAPASEPTRVAEASQSGQSRNDGSSVGQFSTQPTRVVTENDSTATPDFSRNADIVAGLTDLHYLADGEPATPESVEAAVDAFAVDERFALPISADVLLARLDAAVERSQTLPECSTTSPADLCSVPGN